MTGKRVPWTDESFSGSDRILMEIRTGLQFFVLTHFLHANRHLSRTPSPGQAFARKWSYRPTWAPSARRPAEPGGGGSAGGATPADGSDRRAPSSHQAAPAALQRGRSTVRANVPSAAEVHRYDCHWCADRRVRGAVFGRHARRLGRVIHAVARGHRRLRALPLPAESPDRPRRVGWSARSASRSPPLPSG